MKNDKVTRRWKIYGAEGHRQAWSFEPSAKYDWSDENDVRIVEMINSDKTGTNEYTIISITRGTAEECEKELNGQLTDGFFENYRYGKVEEVEVEE